MIIITRIFEHIYIEKKRETLFISLDKSIMSLIDKNKIVLITLSML